MRASVWILAACLWGCGYQMVRPVAGGGARVGPITDLTPHGDLGLRATDLVRRRIAGLEGQWTVQGTVRGADAAGAVAAGAASTGPAERLRLVGVEVELTLEGPDGRPRARSGPIRRTRPAPLAADPIETHGAMRSAVHDALDDAVGDALDVLLRAAGPGDRP